MNLNQLIHHKPSLGRSLLDLDLDQLFGGSYTDENLNLLSQETVWRPSIDVQEEGNRFIVKADLPGIDKKDIEVNLNDNVLTIQGKREFETKQSRKNMIRQECFEGIFYRQFTLPEIIDSSKISATSKDGVLTVLLPKLSKAKKKKNLHKIDIK